MSANNERHCLGVPVVIFAILLVLAGCESQQTQSQSQSQSSSSSSQSDASLPSSSSSFPSGSQSTNDSGGQSNASSQSSSSVDGQQDGQQGSQTGGYVVNGEVLTEEEYVRVLEGEMDASVAVFDGMILDERETVQGIEDANPDQGFPDGTEDEPLFEEGDLSEGGGNADAIPDMPAGAEGDPGQSGEASEGDPTQTARSDGGIPSDIEDGSDDDIVARQIREAAMKEPDPVLREKLWDEYRKYKNQ